MKKMFCISLMLFSLLGCNFTYALMFVDNNDPRFIGQPCYGIDNDKSNGKGYIISPGAKYGSPLEKSELEKSFDIQQNDDDKLHKTADDKVKKNNNEIKSNNGDFMLVPMIKCRINSVEFFTPLYVSNYVNFGNKYIIRYYYAQDDCIYYLKYKEDEHIFVPYTQEEIFALIINNEIN